MCHFMGKPELTWVLVTRKYCWFCMYVRRLFLSLFHGVGCSKLSIAGHILSCKSLHLTAIHEGIYSLNHITPDVHVRGKKHNDRFTSVKLQHWFYWISAFTDATVVASMKHFSVLRFCIISRRLNPALFCRRRWLPCIESAVTLKKQMRK